eukprot:UN09240
MSIYSLQAHVQPVNTLQISHHSLKSLKQPSFQVSHSPFSKKFEATQILNFKWP